MTKYYCVRTPEQWDWLKNKLGIEDDLHVSNFPATILYDDVIFVIYRYYDDLEPLIEVSQMMEDEKMKNEDYVVIRDDDLLKLKDDNNDLIFMTHKDGSFDEVNGLRVPKSLLYPKVPMTEAEKKEFDKLKDEMSLDRHDLDDLLTRIKDSEDFPLLYHRLYVADGDGVESQLEFARAWADPSLVEVIPEKRWNVKIPPFSRTDRYYYKDGGKLGWADSDDNDEEDQQFTESELKEYGLDDDMYEKVEVTDDGTK